MVTKRCKSVNNSNVTSVHNPQSCLHRGVTQHHSDCLFPSEQLGVFAVPITRLRPAGSSEQLIIDSVTFQPTFQHIQVKHFLYFPGTFRVYMQPGKHTPAPVSPRELERKSSNTWAGGKEGRKRALCWVSLVMVRWRWVVTWPILGNVKGSEVAKHLRSETERYPPLLYPPTVEITQTLCLLRGKGNSLIRNCNTNLWEEHILPEFSCLFMRNKGKQVPFSFYPKWQMQSLTFKLG